MDYAAAKTIFQEVSPNLILEPDTGTAHIVVRKPGKGKPPFSITLPNVSHLDHESEEAAAAAERKALVDAFAVAER